jgi:hypothetical protein
MRKTRISLIKQLYTFFVRFGIVQFNYALTSKQVIYYLSKKQAICITMLVKDKPQPPPEAGAPYHISKGFSPRR